MDTITSEEAICQFNNVTGNVDNETASNYLKIAEGSVEQAIAIYLDSVDQISYNDAKLPQSTATSTCEQTARIPDEIYTQQLIAPVSGNKLSSENYISKMAQTFSSKKQKLKDPDKLALLFMPPDDINCLDDFEEARNIAGNAKRWLLVNIQHHDIFQCYILNRDIWSNDNVKELLIANFIFWQREENEDDDGTDFCTLYHVKNFPYIGAIDPRTGKELKRWDFEAFQAVPSAVSCLLEFIESPYGNTSQKEESYDNIIIPPKSIKLQPEGSNSTKYSNLNRIDEKLGATTNSFQISGTIPSTNQKLGSAPSGVSGFNAELADLHRIRMERKRDAKQ